MEAGGDSDHDDFAGGKSFADLLGKRLRCLTWCIRPSNNLQTPFSVSELGFLSSASDKNMSKSLANGAVQGQ